MPRSPAVLLLALAGCSAISASLVESKRRSYRGDARVEQRSVRVGDHLVAYLDRGGAGEPLLLLHGFGTDKDNWTFFGKYVPDTYRVIAPDLPGFGESTQVPEDAYDVRAQADRVVAFADALGLAKLHLAGNSMGGNIAARIAIDHPERLRSLALIDAAGVVSPQPSELSRELAAGRNPLMAGGDDGFDVLVQWSFVRPPPIPRVVHGYFTERARAHQAFNEKVWQDLAAKPDRVEGELCAIRTPTLIVWGDHDRIIDPSAAGVYAKGIAGAQLYVLEQCGHAPMIERPEETAEHYLAFLAALPR